MGVVEDEIGNACLASHDVQRLDHAGVDVASPIL